ncbi:hypothetical protein FB45DRAFT_865751 [Roridomyces roridus]|uniref:Uncharacterized protein n=1 Tax=Roridomyces roridus TaxID=1738132 RepID=A0AAD7C026_9AGAR|nr:hypothetical protein FB45DRAFT_865751 [Roridomyces roridus]
MVSGEARAAGEGVRGVGIARKIARRFLVGSREAEMGGDGSRWCKWGAWVMNTPLEGPAPADSSFFRLRSWFILKERTQVADSDPIGKHDSWRDHGFGTGFLGQISSMGLGYDDLSSRGADSARETVWSRDYGNLAETDYLKFRKKLWRRRRWTWHPADSHGADGHLLTVVPHYFFQCVQPHIHDVFDIHPLIPIKLKFMTRVYNPNVSSASGAVGCQGYYTTSKHSFDKMPTRMYAQPPGAGVAKEDTFAAESTSLRPWVDVLYRPNYGGANVAQITEDHVVEDLLKRLSPIFSPPRGSESRHWNFSRLFLTRRGPLFGPFGAGGKAIEPAPASMGLDLTRNSMGLWEAPSQFREFPSAADEDCLKVE